ncbi:methyltransferase [Rhodospirillum rubrum]|uniref:Methyltransferase domain-containing protein n=1 Tax=Rhodospirillum rubrum (strain ATCC 11170 / ATH 1.1.1 / DSM 467 / LMG 4362 / NCIMB 8255 / S1) TaxID=269796 RepID=Q2RNR9_RHORT|nr:methyltransferase [Rhodospirillum rubrum]ABC24226.1 hypothetical protein Rru_A3432 [Rhodospirillum rubrum ATCC 11170]AEO49977.1 hypothetical protein F11_17585 [Rhodospirillum rubrum F11]MBK5955944.1 hypothetical protein [Rhodospirillum rubrum]QXG80161.1 methyltransferase regulatory domain-containing protein [Rhodospirillum rubrum]HCF17253.1 methyltransferase domain-containing protein [Rhodospirillum rubrum]
MHEIAPLSPAAAALADFQPDRGPAALNGAAVFCGFAPRPLDDGFTWADFGCGLGITASILAAANPQGRFFAIDADGQALAAGRALAKAAFLDNLTFLQADYTKPHDLDLPPLDFAVLGNVLCWLDGQERQALLSRLGTLLKPGGIVLATYDALPGAAALVPLRDLLFSVTAGQAANPVARARAAIDWLGAMRAAGIDFFRDNPALGPRLDALIERGPQALAGRFFGGTLRPLHFAQVNAEMAAQGLTFAGRAEAFLNLIDLAVPAALRPRLRAATSRAEVEATRDFIRNEDHRRDLYIKGAAPSDGAALTAFDDGRILGPAAAPGQANPEVSFGAVSLSFRGALFESLLAALDLGPRPVGELCASAALEGVPPGLIRDGLRLLTAGGLARPYARAADVAPAAPPVWPLRLPHPLNRALALTLGLGGPTVALASKVLGDGVVMDNRDALLLVALCDAGPEGAVERALAILADQAIPCGPATTQALTDRLSPLITDILPWLRVLGVVEG